MTPRNNVQCQAPETSGREVGFADSKEIRNDVGACVKQHICGKKVTKSEGEKGQRKESGDRRRRQAGK